jgi:hypothetical protein
LRSGSSLPSWKPGEILGAGALADRARWSAQAAGGAFGFGVGFDAAPELSFPGKEPRFAASSLASAARSGSRRGAWGYLSYAMVGSYVTLDVTATNAGVSTTATSEEVGPIEEATR